VALIARTALPTRPDVRPGLVPTVLVLRASGLGDVLVAVPALRLLRRALPAHRIVLAGPLGPGLLLHEAGVVDDVVPTGPEDLRPRWHDDIDIAVNFHGRGPESHRALLSVSPQRLIAFDCPDAGVSGPMWHGPDRAEAQRNRWQRLISETLGVAPGEDVRLPRRRFAGRCDPRLRGIVVMHPGAAARGRRWPPDRFAAVAAAVAAARRPVAITGSGAEADLVAEVVGLAAHPAVSPMVCRTVLDLAAVVASSSLVVCGDTGVGHLAAAFSRPSVHLMGPSHPGEWGPPPGPHEVIWHGRTGDPHADVVDAGLEQITVDEVMAAVVQRAGV
jgi:ADP-heptose:LPS heptosyltransferase